LVRFPRHPADREDGSTRALVFSSDITGRKQTENLLRMQSEILERIAVGARLEEVLGRACALAEQQLPGATCAVLVRGADGETLDVLAAPGLERVLREALETRGVAGLAETLGAAAGPGERVIVDDTASDPRWDGLRGAAARFGIGACWSAPVLSERGPVGAFVVILPRPRRPGEHGGRVLDTAAHLAGIAIQRARDDERLRLTQFSIDRSSVSAFWLDPSGRFIYVNEEACRALGWHRDELLSMRLTDIDPELTAERFSAQWQAVKIEKRVEVETRHRARDGRTFPVELSANYFEFGGREYVCAFARDIRKRKQVEETLRESEDRFSRAFRSSPLAMLIARVEDGRLVDVNDEFLRGGGWSREEALGHTTEELGLWGDPRTPSG